MNFIQDFKDRLFQINDQTFEESSLALFEFQYHNNATYKLYCDTLKRTPKTIEILEEIPFLPIEFFKSHVIESSKGPIEKVFKSSGTTSSNRSHHYVRDLPFYHKVSEGIFQELFGEVSNYTIIALLPSYLEQGDSSLINMVDHFMSQSLPRSDYFLGKDIQREVLKAENPIVFGVSHALLDLPKITAGDKKITIIETGGMKGRKKEITRVELHEEILKRVPSGEIWSEYGMTELLSQAYGKNGAFRFPKWARVLIREVNDPFSFLSDQQTGGVNVIDLANIESCAFIETKDLGKTIDVHSFEILGRFDNSDIRGCNLML